MGHDGKCAFCLDSCLRLDRVIGISIDTILIPFSHRSILMSIKRNVYLETLPLPEAVSVIRAALDRDALVCSQSVAAQDAAGRVLSAPVFARYSAPTVHSAAMDGYAVAAADTFAAREGQPLELVDGKNCFAVNTGHPLPPDCDAVIMIEQCDVQPVPQGSDRVRIEKPAFPWQHVRRIGEDIVATELLFPRNHVLGPYDVGALLAGGIWEVEVWENLRVRIIPTGDEVLDFTAKPDPGKGQVVESNSQVLRALAQNLGCIVERIPPVPDSPEALHAALQDSLKAGMHLTIFCAGSSAGSKDFTRATIEREGSILVHGIAAMPGKPSIAGICQGRLVIGAPGYPVSNVVCFEEMVSPIIAWLNRKSLPTRTEIPVELMRKVPSRLGIEEFVRLSVGRVADKAVGIPLGRGAGNITTLTRAQAIARIPASVEGWAENSLVPATLTVPPQDLDTILVCVGSHDNTLDLLADALMGLPNAFRLVSTHVGSMGGITALKSGSCHLAGMHLLDEDSGDFNFSFLDTYYPEADLTLINLAIRHQGIIVAKGNPHAIQGVEQLRGGDIRFINRQRGAGTRILFDWHLKQAQISPEEVNGYAKEESTHMAVAVNVLTGAAHCGMGIYAAAKALDLDFVPLARERYDLAIPNKFMSDPRIQAVISLLHTEAFKERIRAMGGYETTLTGQVMTKGIKLG